jgi:hypothetical protein
MIPGDTLTQAFADLGDANGTWTLRFLDACYADTGTVASADLYLTTDGVPVDTDGDGVPDVADDCPAKRGIAPTGCPDTTAPDTAFSTSPVDGVAKSLSVPFAFVATEAAVIYRCSFDGGAPAPCTNPTTLTVRPGRHTFSVAARDASGNIDPYPATSTFTAYDCPTLTAKVAKLRKKLSATKKAIKTTTAALAAAVKSGDHAKAKALEDRLQKLERTLKSTTKKLAKAKLAAAPCGARAPARS